MVAAARRMWRPIVAVIVSALLAVGTIAVDRRVVLALDTTITEGVASAFLATIAGTMITATVVVFWIRGLLISTRTGYVPNRVLSSYLDDPDQQWLMGATVGVFVIASITLLSATEDAGSRPSITVVSVGLATVATLIAIIHSISAGASAMHEQRILRRIVDTTLSTIDREYPDEDPTDEAVPPADGEGAGLVVRSTRLGWLRSVDAQRRGDVARRAGIGQRDEHPIEPDQAIGVDGESTGEGDDGGGAES